METAHLSGRVRPLFLRKSLKMPTRLLGPSPTSPLGRCGSPCAAAAIALVVVLGLVCQTGPAIAEPPPAALGSEDYAARQQAMRKLWSDRGASREQVERAARDPDPEIAARARWILEHWRAGLLPDTPPEVLRQISDSDGVVRLEALLSAGLFEGVIVAVEQNVGAADAPLMRSEISDLLERRFPIHVRIASESDQLESYLRLLDVASDSPSLAVARAQLIDRLGDDLQQRGLLPRAAERWSQDQRTRTEVMVLATLGRWDEALALADAPGLQDLRRACWMLSGRWQALAHSAHQSALAASPHSAEAYAHWSDCLIAATRAGDSALRQQAAEQLADGPDEATAADASSAADAAALRWRSLMVNGQVDAAIDVLTASQPADAAEVLLSLGRPDDALRQLGIDPADREPGLEQLLHDAALEQLKAPLGDPFGERKNEAMTRLMAAGRLLISTGSAARAKELFSVAAQLPDSAEQTDPARLQVVRALIAAARPQWAFELAAGPDQQTIGNGILFELGFRLADREIQAFATVWQGLMAIHPQMRATDRLRLTAELFDGDPPSDFDRQVDLERLYNQLFARGRAIRSINGRAVLTGEGSFNVGLGDFFLRLGRQDLARQIYRQVAADGDDEGNLRLASLELAAGRAEEALSLYRALWIRSSSSGNAGSSKALAVRRISRSAEDATLALKAAAGEAVCLQRMGRSDAADAQWHTLRLMLCTPSGAVRQQLAEHLSEAGQPQRAQEELESLIPFTALGIDETLELYQVTQLYSELMAEAEPARAAKCSDLAIAGTLESTVYFPRAYVLLPARTHALAALGAAKQGDADRMRQHLDAALRLQPINIDLAEELLPQLREAGYSEEADRALHSVVDHGMQYLDQFPLDANSANNLAWVMALADYRLDDALRLALRATYLQPDSISYRDTLAEVLYRQGRREEALLIERHCLLDEAGEWHLHEQIERFIAEKP